MSVIRIKKKQTPYVTLNTAALNDERLSFRACGLHTYLMSKPDNWEVLITQLEKRSPREGRDAIRTALQELIDAGYLKRSRKQNKDTGRMAGWESTIYETPELAEDGEESGATENGLSEVGSTNVGLTNIGSTNVGSTNVGQSAATYSCIYPDLNLPNLNVLNPSVSPSGETSSRDRDVLTPESLVALYNALTPPSHPKVERLTEARKVKAKKYLRQFPELSFWETVFTAIQHSELLLGLCPSPGHENFKATFDWLLTRGKNDQVENCAKVFEGRYRDTPRASPDTRISEKGQYNLQSTKDFAEMVHARARRGSVRPDNG